MLAALIAALLLLLEEPDAKSLLEFGAAAAAVAESATSVAAIRAFMIIFLCFAMEPRCGLDKGYERGLPRCFSVTAM